MSNEKNVFPDQEPMIEAIDAVEEEMALDDARRVKSLSPGMLVFKRFIRNKLAVVGLAILIFMFIFAFIGPLFMPYEQDQYFTYTGTQSKDYAGAIYNKELRYTIADGEEFGSYQRAKFLLALGKNEEVFSVDEDTHYIDTISEGTYRIIDLNPVAEELLGRVNPVSGATLPDGLVEAYEVAKDAEITSFELDGVLYRITQERKTRQISTEENVALASLNIFDAYGETDLSIVDSFGFQIAAEQAIADGMYTFTVDDEPYAIEYDEGQITVYDQDGQRFAGVSEIIVNPLDQNEFLSLAFKSTIRQTIRNLEDRTTFPDENGDEIEYRIARVNQNYYIRRQTPTELISIYELPSDKHPLGLDNNGMDNLTRLMYGGRISLMVGFVVVILEMFIGVIIGGVSGYFGGGVDTALMRFVDLFNSIPFYPVVIIFGSVMDTLDVEPITRIFLLMAILGVLGWTGIARVVRGQILSLREQDFMVATEATGIKTSRRIFRHLVPNVMPLLIVSATASLGGIIISEATLGFLGLGVRYPLASWGSIINVASDPYVMTNFWFMWIPAGLLILLTVLGFNFVGDGLRDAFDPKMKR
jgi:peptide/nickel transport system permease protein